MSSEKMKNSASEYIETEMTQEGDEVVYLIHFDTKIKHARHYIGWTNDLAWRITCHANGGNRSAAIMRAVKKLGIKWKVVKIWHGDRTLERKIKRRKNASRECPLCKQEGKNDF